MRRDNHEIAIRRKGRPPSPDRTRPVEVRHCWRHGDSEFALYGRVAPQWRCKRCVAEAVTRRHRRVRQILVEQAGGRCAVCGYDRCIISLHFHHVDPASKSFNMTMATGKSEAAYLAEAQKCVLVCANCHGEIEAGLIDSPPAPAMRAGSAIPAEIARQGRDPTARESAMQLCLELGDVEEHDGNDVEHSERYQAEG